MSQPVTLKEIAAESGLSIAAVSKALNGYPNVSDATRQRVLEASERLGYQRRAPANGRESSRRSRRSAHRVGLVLPRARLESRSVDHWACVMTRAAKDYNVRVELVELPEPEPEAGWAEIGRQAPEVGGLVFYGYVNAALAQIIGAVTVPAVAIGDVDPMQPRPQYQVSVDAQGMGLFTTRTLLAAGHRRIGFIGAAGSADGWADQWRKGYQLAMLESEAGFDPILAGPFKSVSRYQLGVIAAEHMAALPDPPTAYVVTDLSPLVSFRAEMAHRGIALGPESLAASGTPTGAAEHGLTGMCLVGVDLDDAAAHTLHLLCRLIRGERVPPVHIRVPFFVHPRV